MAKNQCLWNLYEGIEDKTAKNFDVELISKLSNVQQLNESYYLVRESRE